MFERFALCRRAVAAGWHLLISAALAALAATLVFWVWYPGDYKLLSGGRHLFFLVTGVDVVLGPLLTFAVFNVKKGWPHLRRDLMIIGLFQSAALVYGLHTVYVVRPIGIVFEVDRFRVIAAIDVDLTELPRARAEYRQLPLTGPWLLGTRSAAAGEERNEALSKGLKGIDPGQRPTFWQPYAESVPDVLLKSRPLSVLLEHYAVRAAEFRTKLAEMEADEATARFLPLMARGDWIVVVNAGGAVLGYLQADGFF